MGSRTVAGHSCGSQDVRLRNTRHPPSFSATSARCVCHGFPDGRRALLRLTGRSPPEYPTPALVLCHLRSLCVPWVPGRSPGTPAAHRTFASEIPDTRPRSLPPPLAVCAMGSRTVAGHSCGSQDVRLRNTRHPPSFSATSARCVCHGFPDGRRALRAMSTVQVSGVRLGFRVS